MKLTTLLSREGYNWEPVTLYNVKGSGKDIPAIKVNHPYNGLYPSAKSLRIASAVERLARKYRYQTERRGSNQVTLIKLYPI